MIHIYGFDPGGTIGYAYATIENKNLSIQDVKHLTQDQFDEWCLEMMCRSAPEIVIVAEDYMIDPKRSGYDHQGDKGLALRQLGALRLVSLQRKCRFALQPNFRKPAGYRWLGLEYVPGKKGRHLYDALAHLGFYGVEHKLFLPNPIVRTEPEPDVPQVSNRPKFRRQSVHVWQKPRTGSGTDTSGKSL